MRVLHSLPAPGHWNNKQGPFNRVFCRAPAWSFAIPQLNQDKTWVSGVVTEPA